MPDTLRTTIGQFSSAGGRWQPRAANVRAVEPAADLPSAERGSLYLLIEVSGGGHAALYRQALTAAQEAFYGVGDTVDAAIRQAVRAVHAVLRRANEGLPEAGWRGGMSLVVRYGHRVVIAQAGPSLVLVSHPKTVDQYPSEPGAWGPPLGGEERPEVRIYDTVVEHGSLVLMAQSDWPDFAAPQALAVAAAAPNVELATQYLGQLCGSADLSALLVGFGTDIPALHEDPSKKLVVKTPPVARPEAAAAEGAAGARGILASAGRLLGLVRPAEEPAAPVRAAEPAERDLPPGPAPETVAALGAAELPSRPARPGPAPHPVAVAGEAEGPAAPARLIEPAPQARPAPVATEPETMEEPLVHRNSGVSAPDVPRWRAPSWDREPPLAEPELEEMPRGRSRVWLLLALVVIPILIVAIVAWMLLTRGQALEQQFKEALAGANSVITEVDALSRTDEAAARQRLGMARDLLDEAAKLRPDDPDLAESVTAYQAILERIEHITPLYGTVLLWDFKEEGHSPERVLASGDSLFVFDRGRNAVDRFVRTVLGDSVTPSSEPALRQGQQVSGTTVGALADITWSEAAEVNQRSRLLALETTGGVVSYDVTFGPQRLVLGGTDKLRQPKLAAGYDGKLYIVDAGANQIWRYLPTAKGFEGEPEAYFPSDAGIDFSAAQSIAIDGYIWVLFSDGRLLKFLSGVQQAFVLQDVPGPLSGPTALAVGGSLLYIVDAGNDRILELTKEGEFVRQFRPRDNSVLPQVRGMYLDEAASMFYLLTGDQLYKANLPKVEEAE